jgi:RimJ/RimL family protein N-acetyltransferase
METTTAMAARSRLPSSPRDCKDGRENGDTARTVRRLSDNRKHGIWWIGMKWAPGSPVELETENYLLRSMRPEDFTDRYVSWWTDPEIWGGTPWPLRDLTRDQHVKRLARQFDNERNFQLGVFDGKSGLLAGFFAIFLKPNQRWFSLNVIIGEPDYWGRGIVVEAGAAVFDFAFAHLDMDRVMIEAMARNIPTIYNLKSLGFQYEGVLREEWWHPDGKRVDVCVFGLLNDEWLARRGQTGGGRK